jgi:hypothetical protein
MVFVLYFISHTLFPTFAGPQAQRIIAHARQARFSGSRAAAAALDAPARGKEGPPRVCRGARWRRRRRLFRAGNPARCAPA